MAFERPPRQEGTVRSPASAVPPGVAAERLLTGRPPTTWTLPEQVAAQIGERILNEELNPGQRIGEDEVAQFFGISRGPIRDALRLLDAAGLVMISRRRGTVVTRLTERDLREILELREVLMGVAFRRFSRVASAADVATVRPNLRAAETLVADDAQMFYWLEALDRLVLAIAHRAGNARLARQLTLLSLQAIRYLRRGMRNVDNRRELLAFHRDYLQAVERGADVEPFIGQLHALVQKRIGIVSSGL